MTLTAERVDPETNNRTTCTITTAVVGRTVFASNATSGPRVEFGERDYLIPPADYKLGPRQTACEPKEGDRFTSTEEGETVVFEVKPIPGEPAWRPTDGRRTFYRVHCKRVTDLEGRG